MPRRDRTEGRTTDALIAVAERWLADGSDVDGEEAEAAVRELGERRAVEAIDVLMRLVADDEEEPDDAAVVALGKIGLPTVEPVLARLATATPGSQLHWAWCDVLSGSGVRDDRIFDALVQLLEVSPDFGAHCLGTYGDPRALSLLTRALHRMELTGVLLRDQTVIEYAAAIEELGGTLTARGRDKVEAYREAARAQLGFLDEPDDDRPPARNAPCPCGSGKKYKRCHGRVA